jgi:hypothetical protein
MCHLQALLGAHPILHFRLVESILMVKKLLNLKFLIKLYMIFSSLAGTDVRRAAVCSNILGCVDV